MATSRRRPTVRRMLRLVALLRRLTLALGGLLLVLLLAGGGVALAARSPHAVHPAAPAPMTPPTDMPREAVRDSITPLATRASDENLSLRLCTARIAAGDSPAARLASLDGFDCATPPLAFGPGSYWLRLLPQDTALSLKDVSANLSVLSFVPGWQQNATFYVRNRDGSIHRMALDNRSLSRLTHVGAQIQLRLHNKGKHPDALLLRIDQGVNSNGLIANPILRSETSSSRGELIETAIYCTFAGLCLALLVFNLALLGSMREGFQMTYCLMVIGMLTYAWSHSGGWSLWFPDRDITERFRLGYVALGLTSALALRFFVDFLENNALPGWLRWLASVQRLALLIASAAMVVVPQSMLMMADRVYVWVFVALPVLAVAMTLMALRGGSRAARVLLLTWTVPVLGGLTRLAYALHLVGYNALSDHSPLIAMGFNALLSSLAIAMRVKILAEERDHARNEERVAKRLADIDPLTGLLNRRGLLAQAAKDGTRGALRLMIVDVDHFKAINDTHGHDIGDDVLCELSRVLTRRTARRGRVARLGGEEFAVIGAASDLSPALALAILADVRQHHFPKGIAMTVSIGLAEGEIRADTQGDADWSILYRRADTALYEAKTTGRNRVVDAALMDAGMGGFGTLPPEDEARLAM